ncbi:hypothetical protein RQP46_004137 [Phenoliferia psychrophenolica]
MEGAPTASTSKPAPTAAPGKKEKRKLACAACRARRIRCEWTEAAGCIACDLAELRCPGEPEPRKRAKKNPDGTRQEPPPAGAFSPSGGNDPSRLELGGALTFHLIESHFLMANPCIPGAPYNLYRDLLNAAGGSSRELEIAAECLCSAFIASAASFSDHSSIVGPGLIEMPSELHDGSGTTYSELVGYGPRRRKVVEQLQARAVELWEEFDLKDHPGVEGIYTLLVMDQMMTLTTEGGRNSRRYIVDAVAQYKALLEQIHTQTPENVAILRGPLLLDAQTAATLRQPLSFSLDTVMHFPSVNFEAPGVPTFDASQLGEHENGWTNLGVQLAPLSLAFTHLFRTFVTTSTAAEVPSPQLHQLWHGVASAFHQLDLADSHISTLPALETAELTHHRQFDLQSLTNAYRRRALLLDLLIHEHILDALQSAGPSNPSLITAYETSIQRVKHDFQIIAKIAQHDAATRSLLFVRRLFEMMEVCSTWTSLRSNKTSPETASLLVAELGISAIDTTGLMNALDLASWSLVYAAEQKKGVLAGLTFGADSPLPTQIQSYTSPPPLPQQLFDPASWSSPQTSSPFASSTSYTSPPSFSDPSLDPNGFPLGLATPYSGGNEFMSMDMDHQDPASQLDAFFADYQAPAATAPPASTSAGGAMDTSTFEYGHHGMDFSAGFGSQPQPIAFMGQHQQAQAQAQNQNQQWWRT